MAGLESDYLERADRAGQCPEPRPETHLLDAYRRNVAHFVALLRVVSEVGDEMKIALGHQYERAGPRKASEIAHVRQTREHEAINVRRSQRLTPRRDSRGSAVSHPLPPEAP